MKHGLYFGITTRLIFLFVLAMFATFIPEHLREFFGDKYNSGYCNDNLDPCYVWGARHFWYWFLMFFLFVLSAINLIMHIDRLIDHYYPPDINKI